MRQALMPDRLGIFHAALPRWLSLLAAIALAATTLAYPRALAHLNHGVLMLLMLGMSAGFVHGVGFVPEHRLWRALFSPAVAWPLLAMGLWLAYAN